MNKRSEINDLVDAEKPHVLALTEFGASGAVMDSELGIEGYSLYRGNHSDGKGGLGRGTALYISNSLNHSACPLFDDVEFDCSAWSVIKLSTNKSLLVGVVYRSPNSSDQNNLNMLTILGIAARAKCSQLVICGDFNLPLINWYSQQSLDTETSLTSKFIDVIEDFGWHQHVRASTRFRNNQNSCLDLVFTSEENMVNEVTELPPIGKSDHVCQKWKLVVEEIIYKNTIAARHNFKRADWVQIKSELRDFQFDPADSPMTMNDKLVQCINDLKLKHIPLCRVKSIQHRLPWMRSAKLKSQRAERWRRWKRFRESRLPRD